MTKPFQFQKEDVEQIQKWNGRVLVANEMGTGKSLISLLWAHKNPEVRPIVVVCPASLKWNWSNEASKHLNMRAEVLEGTRPPALRRMRVHHLVIINYDILTPWLKYLKSIEPKLIILDECHMLGSPSTKRTKAVRVLCKDVPHVLALSGTPLTNRPAELWPTLNILRPDLYPTSSVFAMTHCRPRKTPWGWEFKGATKLKKLHRDLTSAMMIRRLKKDVLDQLPVKQRNIVLFDIEKRKEYEQAKDDFLGWMSEHNPSRLSKAEKAQRLVQMGYLKRLVGQLKMKSVLSWIDAFLHGCDGKLVAFAIHKKAIAAILERYPKLSVVVDGSVTGRDRQIAVDRFQKDKRIRLFVGNIKAAGVGISLTAAKTSCFVEMDWVPGNHTQAEDRIHRIGQEKETTCHYLIAKDTIEAHLVEIIQKKQEVISKILNGKKDQDVDIFDELTKKMMEEEK